MTRFPSVSTQFNLLLCCCEEGPPHQDHRSLHLISVVSKLDVHDNRDLISLQLLVMIPVAYISNSCSVVFSFNSLFMVWEINSIASICFAQKLKQNGCSYDDQIHSQFTCSIKYLTSIMLKRGENICNVWMNDGADLIIPRPLSFLSPMVL